MADALIPRGTPIASISAAFCLALVVGASLMPVAIAAGRRWGLVVSPRLFGKANRSISFLGGVGLASAATAAYLLVGEMSGELVPFLLGGVTLLMLGLWDDTGAKLISNPMVRLALQVGVAAGATSLGLRIDIPGLPGTIGSIILLTACMNAFNLLDNMDGVAGSAGAGTAAGISVIAAMAGQFGLAVLAAAICGACLGFLVFNLSNAKVYLGNSGSLLLGFLLGAAAIKLRTPMDGPWGVLLLATILSLPASDTGVAVASRLAHGRSIVRGGVDHISHRLVTLGLRKQLAAVAHGVASLIAGLFAALALHLGRPAVLILVLVTYAAGDLMLLRVTVYGDQPDFLETPTFDQHFLRANAVASLLSDKRPSKSPNPLEDRSTRKP